MTPETPQEQDKLMIRLPPGMRSAIKVAATRNRRSMNAEVVFHLEKIFSEARPHDVAA